MLERLWTYQRERFPLPAMVTLALLLGTAAPLYSALVRGALAPEPGAVGAAAASTFLVFVQMRVLDEFKDRDDDARHRPYLPVPRGLVSLEELGWVLAAASAGQVAIALAVDVRLLGLLAALWGFLVLMTVEFFARTWLRSHPFAYFASHIPFGGLVALYATAFEWLPRAAGPHPALALFALTALFATALLEIGRKVRSPRDEETGVVTYSSAWGMNRATAAWIGTFALVAISGWIGACAIGRGGVFAALMALPAIAAAIGSMRYLRARQGAKGVEAVSGIATLVLYAGLGPIPALLGA